MAIFFKEKIERIRYKLGKIPPEYRRWSAYGLLLAFLIALPLTVLALTSGNFEMRKRAATGEITPTPTIGPTPTMSLGQVRIHASSSTQPIEQGQGIITLWIDNDSANNINLIQLFMTYDPRIIDFTANDVELWISVQGTAVKEVYKSGNKKQLRLILPVNYYHTGSTIVMIRYAAKRAGVTQLVFQTDLKTGTLENKVTAVGSDANLIKELINGSVTITKAPKPTKIPR